MTIELSVLVPCFNEEGNIPELVERTERVFDRRSIAGEIVLVNDGSRDGTGAQIDALAASRPHVVAVHHPTNRGISEGWKSAFANSRGRYVCTIDADLQYQPEAIALLYREACFSKADLVQGWRSSLELRRYDIRFYMSRGLDHLLKLAFGMHEHDVKSGFVIYKREVFEDILAYAPAFYYFQHMITVVAQAKGYSLRQVETLFLERRAGESFINAFPGKMIFRTFVDIGRGLVDFRFRETKDQSLALALGSRPGTEAAPATRPSHTPRDGMSRNAAGYLDELRQTQWLPGDELQQLQLRRLRRLIHHAYEHVGYYREHLQTAGVVPDDIRTVADLAQLPVLTRHAVRDNLYFDLFADTHGARNIAKLTTSGASGEPLSVFVDRLQLDMRWAHGMRGAGWAGFHLPGRRARWSRAESEGRGVLLERWDAWRSRPRLFHARLVDEALADRYADYVRQERPALLEGDAEVFNLVASLLHERGRDARGAGAIRTWGQTLTPAVRRVVESVFGCPVFDEYGVGELGPIANECETHAGYHVNAESYIVEVMRDGRPAAAGELGDVLVTDLNARSVPLVRYHLGDLAAVSGHPCPCGRSLPLLERVVGRPQSAILASRGCVPGSVFADLFKDFEHAIARYHVRQESTDGITLQLVRRSRFTSDTESVIRDTLTLLLGTQIRLDIEFVDALPASPGAPGPTCVSGLALPLVGEASAAPAAPDELREVSR